MSGMIDRVLSAVRQYWRYAVAALLVCGVAVLAWNVIQDSLRWGLYRSTTEPVFSVRYPLFMEVRDNYIDPLLPGSVPDGVSFSVPQEVLEGSRLTQASITFRPLRSGSCDAKDYAGLATTSRSLAEKGVTYSYAMGGRNNEGVNFQARAYILPGSPCFLVRYNFNFAPGTQEPDAPQGVVQSRKRNEGTVHYPQAVEMFDTMRRSLNVKR